MDQNMTVIQPSSRSRINSTPSTGREVFISSLDDLINSGMLPIARAAIELHNANPVKALNALRSRDYDLCCKIAVPNYYRGLAYLENNQPELARREFQNLLSHRFLSASFSSYLVLSQLELGHAYKLLGDAKSADTAFEEVERTWKDADLNFQPLAKLRRYRELLPSNSR